MNSQPTLTKIGEVQVIEINGDTLIQMHLADAKIVLNGLLEGEIADSLLKVYMVKDSINNDVIAIRINQISLLQEKSENQEKLNKNLNLIIKNKNLEIDELNTVIKEQDRVIKKERFIKKLALIGTVVLPIIVLIAVTSG